MFSPRSARIFSFALACSTVAAGQNPTPLLLRMQVIDPTSNSCALLRSDGSFHFERIHKNKSRVLEGALKHSDLAKLKKWLVESTLRSLTQQEVGRSEIVVRNSVLQLSVVRGDRWQDLIFPDAASQRRYAASLDPFLKWFQHLPKAANQDLWIETGKTNCSTAGDLALKTRP